MARTTGTSPLPGHTCQVLQVLTGHLVVARAVPGQQGQVCHGPGKGGAAAGGGGVQGGLHHLTA